MVRTTFFEREHIRKLNQTVRRCNRNRRRPECQDLPSDENGKFYNPANPPQTTPSTTITTTTTARTRPRSDVIDRGVIDRGVIVRPPNIVISRDDPDESYRDQNYQNVSTKVFNPFTPVTEIQNRRTDPAVTTTQQPAVTLNGTFTLTPNQIANTAGPEILFPGGSANVNGWILLVGILGGTIVLVTLVWNSMKLWCRKCERDACRQPPTITYLTPDQALSNSNNDTNRLAEVPVMAINTFHLETGANCLQSGSNGTETLLTNAELNRLMIANQNRQAGHGGPPPVLIQNQSPTMTQATTVTPDSEPPSYSQVISETSRENDNDTLNATESIEESTELGESEETAAAEPEAETQQEENDNDSISSADTVNSVQRVQSV